MFVEKPCEQSEAEDASDLGVRSSGYFSRSEELWYGISSPFYDIVVWWGFLPFGGEKYLRREFVRWFDVQPGQDVLSLCCGTGTTERALIAAVPTARMTALDLGGGQLARARRKDRSGTIDYRLGNASDTGFEDDAFDRVLITLALHEMPRKLRLSVLREAARVCRPTGRVIAIEHAPMTKGWSWFLRGVWWFGWVPGNPEVATSRDLQRHGLAREMEQAGLRVRERYTTTLGWIEGVVAEPVGARGRSG
jgi:demethylmenaquinone methyltransferase/2-methoxy-6-polyprenyl-1,4-benzoquinol methylase